MTVEQRLEAAELALMAVTQSGNLWTSWLPKPTVAQIRTVLGARLADWEAERDRRADAILDRLMEKR